jgi:hypothetical protein
VVNLFDMPNDDRPAEVLPLQYACWVPVTRTWRALGIDEDEIPASTMASEVGDGIWLVSFMHYDLGYFDLEQKTLQPLDNPFGTRLSPMS